MTRSLDDTIAAIATPPGNGGVGIVRISGPDSRNLLDAVFVPSRGASSPAPGLMRHGRITDPASGQVLDEVLSVFFVAPRSFTGQDVAEIHAHGGSLNLRQILDLLLRLGARAAGPGEFTLRAFLNRRMDLSRAEAVRDVIQAQTEAALNASRRHLMGDTRRFCEEARQQLLSVLAHIEAMVDFPDEEIPPAASLDYATRLKTLGRTLERAAASYTRGRLLTEGVEIMIAGAPNVGKSSLMNRLLGRERAIVADSPGTTRDLIEATLDIAGVPARLVDSAGLRDDGDTIEAIGVTRARERLQSTDVVVWVLDASRPLAPEDRALSGQIAGRKGLLVRNKCDLPPRLSESEARALAPGWPLLSLCALNGEGVGELEEALAALFLLQAADESTLVVTSARHEAAFRRAAQAVERATEHFGQAPVWELAAADLREATECLGEIIGVMTPDEILNEIFSTFCIGK